MRSFCLASLLALMMAAGCKAQNATSIDAAASRRIELAVRSQYSIPGDVNVELGARTPSKITGYDDLQVVFSKGEQKQKMSFLLSTDGKTLARLDTSDLGKDPMDAIDLKERPVRGNPNAKVTVVSYDDLECPYCTRMHQTLFPGVPDRYGDLVRVIYKDFPLIQIHPWAMRAAVNANCLNAQDPRAYWAFVDFVHVHMEEVTGQDGNWAKSFDTLNRYARDQATQAKLDSSKLDACLSRQDESKVRASITEGIELGIEGTPALFVDGERVTGLVSQNQLFAVIDRALRAKGIEPPPLPLAAKPASDAKSPATGK